jgi:hypothetical protein
MKKDNFLVTVGILIVVAVSIYDMVAIVKGWPLWPAFLGGF